MTDIEFLEQFTAATLPKTEFKHQAHLRVAWLYLTRFEFQPAGDLITQGIKKYATGVGAGHIYHETLTRAWI